MNELDTLIPTAPRIVRLRFSLLPPTVNHARKHDRFGKPYPSKALEKFRTTAGWELVEQMPRRKWPFFPKEELVHLARFEIPERYYPVSDADNRIKVLQDVVATGCGFNDRMVRVALGFKTMTKKPATESVWMTLADFLEYGFDWKGFING